MKTPIFSLILVLLITMYSCLEDGSNDFLSDFKTIVYFPKSDSVQVTLYKTGEDAVYALAVYKGGSDTKASTTLELSTLSSSVVDSLNMVLKRNYVVLPSSCYAIKSDLKFIFNADEMSKHLMIEFKTDSINKLVAEPQTEYVLALEIKSSTDSINKNKKYVFLKTKVVIPTITFQKEGLLQYNPTPENYADLAFESFLQLPVKSLWDFNVSLVVQNDQIAKYNKDTGLEYSMLPDSAYTINKDVAFSKGDMLKSIGLNVNFSKLDLGRYLLPVGIKSSTMSEFVLSSKTQLIAIDYMPDPKSLIPIALTEKMIDSKITASTWGDGLKGLIPDGSTATYFHSVADGKPDATYGLYFDIVLEKPVKSAYLSYLTREGWGGNGPKRIAVFVSSDNLTWKKVMSVSKGLSSEASTEFKSNVFTHKSEFKYVRFSVLESHNGIMDDTSRNTAGSFAMCELKLWAK